jgi:putative aldouronate transport system substrate-binding protein
VSLEKKSKESPLSVGRERMSAVVKNVRRIVSIIVALPMILSGCNEPAAILSKRPITQSEPEDEEDDLSVKKPTRISFMCNIGLRQEDHFEAFRQEYERLTGILLNFEYTHPNEYYQQLELRFSSGNMPDTFIVGDGKLPIYAMQGVLKDLTELTTQSNLIKKIPTTVLDSVKVDQKIYGIPLEDNSGTVTYVRGDWLEKLDIEVPTTYDEYIGMLRAFKSIGQEIIPMTAPGLVDKQAELYLREFYQEASPQFVKVDGVWVDGMLEPNMVQALYRMKNAYREGLIDVEIITNKTSTCREKWYAGVVGAFTYWAGDWNINMEETLQDRIIDGSAVPIPAIQETHYIKRVPIVVSISTQAQNPEGIFKYFVEYMNDGEEGSILWQHGVENVHWKQIGNQMVHLPTRPSEPQYIPSKSFISPASAIVKIENPEKTYTIDQRVHHSLEILNQDGIQAISIPVSGILSKINADLLILREKTLSSILLAQVGVEEGLRNYATEADKLGIQGVLYELNAYESSLVNDK